MRFSERIKPADDPYHDRCVSFLAVHARWVMMRARPDLGDLRTVVARTEVPLRLPGQSQIVAFIDLAIGAITEREAAWCRARLRRDVERGVPTADLLPYPPEIEWLMVEVKTRPESTSAVRRQLQIYRALVSPPASHALAIERRVDGLDLDTIRGDGFLVVRFHNPVV